MIRRNHEKSLPRLFFRTPTAFLLFFCDGRGFLMR